VSDPLKVALLNPCFFPEVKRGSERLIRELANGLVQSGHAPTLITSHSGAPSRADEDGLRVIRNWRPPDARLTRRLYPDYLTHVPFSYAWLRAGSYDVANAFYPTDALAAVRWAERSGRPAVFSYGGLPDRPVLADRRHKLRILERALRGSAAVVTSSRTAADAMRRWMGVDARPIYPGVDLDSFVPGNGRAAEPTIFCAASPDDSRKRVGLLVAAFARVRRERRDARLVLIEPRDAGTRRRNGLEGDGIELIAQVDSPAALAPTYRRAWVTALTAYREAFGLVLVESLACGTPVVGTRDGAVPEVVNGDRIGRLFDGDDEQAVARALLEGLELAADSGTPGACRARAEEFSTARCAREYEALYLELLGRDG
jgi:glycosyltransferase involved in cell wall biosynthesis